jgi:hypothetical protein
VKRPATPDFSALVERERQAALNRVAATIGMVRPGHVPGALASVIQNKGLFAAVVLDRLGGIEIRRGRFRRYERQVREDAEQLVRELLPGASGCEPRAEDGRWCRWFAAPKSGAP